MNGLASSYHEAGRRDEALKLFEQTLELRKTKFGWGDPEAPQTMQGLTELMLSYQNAGRRDEAKKLGMKLLEPGLEIMKAKRGPDHPETLGMMDAIANLYHAAGRRDEAFKLREQTLELRKAKLGPDHPDTLKSMDGLVDAYVKAKRHHDAETLLKKLSISTMTNKPQQLALLRTRGNIHARLGHWKEASTDFSKVIELQPTNHYDYHALAPLLVQNGDLDAYRQHSVRALASFRGTDDPTIAERMAKACLIWPSAGVDLSAAGELAETAVTVGKKHAYLPYFEFTKGLAEYRQGHFVEAMDWMGKVLAKSKASFLGVEANLVMGMSQFRLGQLDTARASLDKAEEIEQTQLPKMESGDLGSSWIDWIVAHALLKEARELIKKQ